MGEGFRRVQAGIHEAGGEDRSLPPHFVVVGQPFPQIGSRPDRVDGATHHPHGAIHADECHTGWRAVQTRSGVKGMSLMATPVAWRMALRMAGATPSLGISAMALAPKGPLSSMVWIR